FFSSRRRHTRSDRDWSSDMCSSDLRDVIHKAVCGAVAKGVVVVVAAGNSRADASGYVPAAYDEVLTVSAIADFNGQPGEKGKGKIGRASCRERVERWEGAEAGRVVM